eukprot:Hpha_TRINITY_DN15410_c3_g1::TRINITY_DN15410_c3_g1_i4::g.173537::m.173537
MLPHNIVKSPPQLVFRTSQSGHTIGKGRYQYVTEGAPLEEDVSLMEIDTYLCKLEECWQRSVSLNMEFELEVNEARSREHYLRELLRQRRDAPIQTTKSEAEDGLTPAPPPLKTALKQAQPQQPEQQPEQQQQQQQLVHQHQKKLQKREDTILPSVVPQQHPSTNLSRVAESARPLLPGPKSRPAPPWHVERPRPPPAKEKTAPAAARKPRGGGLGGISRPRSPIVSSSV